MVLGETGPGPFPEERSCRPRGVWELLMARMGEGFRLQALRSSLRRSQAARQSGRPLGQMLFLRRIGRAHV